LSKRKRYERASNDLRITGIAKRNLVAEDAEDGLDDEEPNLIFLVHRSRRARRAEFHLEHQRKVVDEATGRVVKTRWKDLESNEKLGL